MPRTLPERLLRPGAHLVRVWLPACPTVYAFFCRATWVQAKPRLPAACCGGWDSPAGSRAQLIPWLNRTIILELLYITLIFIVSPMQKNSLKRAWKNILKATAFAWSNGPSSRNPICPRPISKSDCGFLRPADAILSCAR